MKTSKLEFASLTKIALGLLVSVLIVGCTTATYAPVALATLCAETDLDRIDQRRLLAGGYYAIQSNDLVCAEKLTLKAQQKEPNDAYAALNLGAIYQKTTRPVLARQMYEKAIALEQSKSTVSGAGNANVATNATAIGRSVSEIANNNLANLK